uniref:Uncharacterized protein n=1 Tax=Anguilla anguilla TaxID=7936 RepID=A0A0E9U1B2_ANGAN
MDRNSRALRERVNPGASASRRPRRTHFTPDGR